MIAPFGAMLPLSILIPPFFVNGLSNSFITSLFQHLACLLFSPILFPFTVNAFSSNNFFSSNLFITTGTPPAY